MKIRIVQSGYETFNGLLGDVRFVDGESVHEVTAQQASYVSAMFTCEMVEAEAEAPQADADQADADQADTPAADATDEGQPPAAE